MSIFKRFSAALLLAAVIVIAALANGCNSVPPPISGRLDPYGRLQISYASDDLRNKTAVGTPKATRDEFGTLIVTVDIRNTTDRAFPIDYQVTWFDANGQSIFKESWQTMQLEANIQDQITVKSPSNLAVDFQFDFRDAQ
jgi:hypothetical protein